ncbi:unnamed protein product [Kuraishia capsulata CBS 1993]|uniref:Phosphoglycerate mutase-like protein n=1 Tax=Kuraishia capsulata CBS 1993 TaxID=1382522 RepID=W6MTQ9_9ASCO|nr:uncharacterized protein KUCA_T00004596001 [Kuraishia capsulata CBS 1993]CDK28612.1 unnamed protein product [Kuraishia capsulata CBS 1993]
MIADSQLTNDSKNVLRFFIVRHGQTDHNKKKIMQGHLNTALNEEGFHQAALVGERFKDVPIDAFVSSDLTRCQQTVGEIYQHHKIKDGIDLRLTPNLRERAMGEVEGMYLKDALEKYGPAFRSLGETRKELLTRLWKEWDEIVDYGVENDYTNVLICTHGGVITNFINHLYSDLKYGLSDSITEDDLKVPFNTSVTVVDVEKSSKKGIIQSFGDTSHLGAQLKVKDQQLR